MTGTYLSPPSSLTDCAPPSLTRRPALRTASSTLAWYDMNGMSPTTIAFGLALVTALRWWMISSIVTGRVFSYPMMTMPRESPTSMKSMPVASISRVER